MREVFTKMVTVFGKLLVFLFLFSFAVANAGVKERVEPARAIALKIIAQAYKNKPIDLYRDLSVRLSKANIEVPENGVNFKHCIGATLAYVITPGLAHNEIYFCDRVHYISDEQFAESLIHETSHLLGYSECEAIEIEINTMLLSGRRPLIQNLEQNCNF